MAAAQFVTSNGFGKADPPAGLHPLYALLAIALQSLRCARGLRRMATQVARRDLEALVVVAIACAPPLIQRKLMSKLPHEADEGRKALAQSICERIDNEQLYGDRHRADRAEHALPAPRLMGRRRTRAGQAVAGAAAS